MGDSQNEIRAKVAARCKQEQEANEQAPAKAKADSGAQSPANGDRPPKTPAETCVPEISDADLLAYLNENRLGDAKLYCRLFRGKVVFVRHWERFIVWAGHHWAEDDFDFASQNIETVCQLYQGMADRYQSLADGEGDRDAKARLLNVCDSVRRRLASLRDIPCQDKLLQMVRRVSPPLTILPGQIDKQHYLKACPNGVIDLRTGELRPGRPEQYILNAIATEYAPPFSMSLIHARKRTNSCSARWMATRT